MKSKITAAAIFAAVCVMSAAISLCGAWDSLFAVLVLKNAPDIGVNCVRFADVGQGDCTIVQSEGKIMLIDTGDENHAARLCDYIGKLGFDSVDTVIITHPHADHMGGLRYICSQMPVGRVFVTDTPPDSDSDLSAYDSFLSAYDGERLSVESMADFKFGEFSVSLVLCDSDAEDENDRSAVILLQCNGVSFLVTGDLSTSDSKVDVSADVLKVGHHGSQNAASAAFLERVKPDYAVISVGADNTYGHPSKQTLTRLTNCGAKIYRTDCNGTVTFDVTDRLKINSEY